MQHKPDNQANKELVDFLLHELNLTGLQEIMSEQRVEKIFTKLLRECGIYIGRINSASIMEQERLSSGTCPFCQTPILDESHQVFCKSCGIPHHDECWQENGHCAVFGCGQMKSLKTGLERKEEQSLIVLGENDLGDESDNSQTHVIDDSGMLRGLIAGGVTILFFLVAFISGC